MGTSEKTLNSRILQKHDIEANWVKAENFIPKAGEIIVYDVDGSNTVPRIKIGDGENFINNLPFTNAEILNKIEEFTPIEAVEKEEGHIIFQGVSYDETSKVEGAYELIETITLEEQITQLIRTQEPDGTSYKFERMYILFVGNQVGGSAGVIGFYNQTTLVGSYYAGGVTTPPQYCGAEIRQEAGSWRTTWSDWTTNSTVVHSLNWGNDYGRYPEQSIKDYPYIDKIIFYNTMPAGTEIKIWGVRA